MPKRAKTSTLIVKEIELAPETYKVDIKPYDWFEGTEILRFEEFHSILSNLDPWYRPIAELMVLTGIDIHEMAGLTTQHIQEEYIQVRRRLHCGVQYVISPSTNWLHRDIHITKAIQERLDVLLERKQGLFLATNKAGNFVDEAFNQAWLKAQKDKGMRQYPGCLHSTFIAWSLIVGISRLRIKRVCGSKSKPLIDYIHRYYLKGLAEDRDQILALFGNEFPG